METYSWDVVYACSGSYVNAQLSRSCGTYIQAFTYEDSIVDLSGQFDAWKLVPGGSGTLLHFECPIPQGTLRIKEQNRVVSLKEIVPLVQMQLTLIQGSGQKVTHRLVFHCTRVGEQKDDQTPGTVTVINPDVSGVLQKQKGGALIAGVLATALARCFVHNAAQLSYVFADLLPTPTGTNSTWLIPQSLAYCYQQPNDGSLGGLAILGLLRDASTALLPRTFDATLLMSSDFGFLLSAAQFMQHVVLPALLATLQGKARPDDLHVDVEGGTLTLAKSFDLDRVKVGLINYTPKVTALCFYIEGTFLQCAVTTRTNITGLASAFITNSVSSRHSTVFDRKTRTFSFQKDPNVVTTQNTHIPWWESVVGVLTLGIMNVVTKAVSLAIEDAVSRMESSKTAAHFGHVTPGLVSWSGQEDITIVRGGMQNTIYMQGVTKTS